MTLDILFGNTVYYNMYHHTLNITTLFLMLKHRPYSVAIRFNGMLSYYDHVYKIEKLNNKEEW
jgi:hypothetical protein